MFTPINASKVPTGRKPLPTFRKNPENKLPTVSTEAFTPPARLGEAHRITTTTPFSATSITPPWAIKYERGHLGDLLIPLEAGEPKDFRSYFRGNGKVECPFYNGKKPSWAYVHYVLLSLVPGGKVQSNVLYEMGIEWIPTLEKKAALNDKGQEKKQRKNQSCGSALTRGLEFVCELDDKGEKTKFWYLADSIDGQPKPKKRKIKEENVQDEIGSSSSMPKKPAAKKAKNSHPKMPVRITLKGKNKDAVIPETSNVPTQDRTFRKATNGPRPSLPAYHQHPGHEGFELVAHDEKKSNPGEDTHNTQPLPSHLPSTAPSGPDPTSPLPPIARLRDEAGLHLLLNAVTTIGDLPRLPGYPGTAVGPHPSGKPAALPQAGPARPAITQPAHTRRYVSASPQRATVADPLPNDNDNDGSPRAAKVRDVAHILADMRIGRFVN